jgi:hypothetical protein
LQLAFLNFFLPVPAVGSADHAVFDDPLAILRWNRREADIGEECEDPLPVRREEYFSDLRVSPFYFRVFTGRKRAPAHGSSLFARRGLKYMNKK